MQQNAFDVLEKIFGLHSFRGFQRDVIDHVVAGGDALVLMPTGGGKSLCYQIPALLRPGVAVVVSPLIALMADQVTALEELGVKAVFLNSSLTREQAYQVHRRVLQGDVKILYVAPERLAGQAMRDFLQGVDIALFAIDEAHCVSMWGHDFRPEYGELSFLRENWPDVPRIALTATADRQTREEICERLLVNPRRFVASFDRPNIRYRVVEKNKPLDQLARFIQQEHEGDSGIVYCLSRATTERTEQYLLSKGIHAIAYHAGLEAQDRMQRQRRFLREDAVVMVATIAFGMGIDKPDVRFVAHVDMPKSIENYFQETGRAGRDGEPADAWMAYGLSDVVCQKFFIEKSTADDIYKRRSIVKLEAMLALAQTVSCRRKLILNYFDEPAEACGNCDNCLDPPQVVDYTEAAKKLVSCIYRCRQLSGCSFGIVHITDVLCGKATDKVLMLGHDKLSTFGIGQELSVEQWRRLLRQMIVQHIIVVDADRWNTLELGEVQGLLKHNEKILVGIASPKSARVAAKKTKPAQALDARAQILFERLRGWRKQQAVAADVPPYMIFSDATLCGIACEEPTQPRQLETVSGVGQKKLERYGDAICAIVTQFVDQNP